MMMPNGSASVDQSIFEEAIAEVKRLEGVLVQIKETKPESLSGKPLFEATDTSMPSVITWERAFDDALRVEQKIGVYAGKRPAPERPKPGVKVVSAEDARAAREHDEIEAMKAKFAALSEEARKAPAREAPQPAPPVAFEKAEEEIAAEERPPPPAPREEKREAKPPAVERPEERPAARPAEIIAPKPVPVGQPAPGPAPAPSLSADERAKLEAEKLRLMRERLSRVLKQKPEAAPPAVQQVAQQQPAAKPKRTLFEVLEDKRKIEAQRAPAPATAAPTVAARPAPRPVTGVDAQIAEESKRKNEVQAQRIDALKLQLAEKVRKRKEEEERRKSLEELGNTYEGRGE